MNDESTGVTVRTIGDTCTAWAERAGIERLLNSYLRETGQSPPMVRVDISARRESKASECNAMSQGVPMMIPLPATKRAIWGEFVRVSPSGHHQYGDDFWLEQEHGERGLVMIKGWRGLAAILLEELAHGHPDTTLGEESARALMRRLENSVEKTVHYARYCLSHARPFWASTGADLFLQAEQSLVCGHPLHPTPKSSEGFSVDDLGRYAPELGASFKLHYFAVAPDLLAESFIGPDEGLVPTAVQAMAEQKLASDRRQYRLLPCHPWQADHLKQWPTVQELLSRRLLIDLGVLGDEVYPTSSVRTAWDPAHAYSYKLPINVRITNFIRVNPLEHVKRAFDAARVLADLRSRLPFPDFTILLEVGYRTLLPPDLPDELQLRHAESFGVLFRENPVNENVRQEAPTVVAALLEPSPKSAPSPLWEAVRGAAASQSVEVGERFVAIWLERYVHISLLPLLWLFLEHGVSIEGHVQNTLVTLRDGWPAHFHIRDLEGVSISRERAATLNFFGGRVAEDSLVLYPEEEAWKRFKYYVLVNHLGHVIHVLATHARTPEAYLWQVVVKALQDSGVASAHQHYLRDLLESETLPAKANLVSCFLGRGEKPLYVAVPNLLRNGEAPC